VEAGPVRPGRKTDTGRHLRRYGAQAHRANVIGGMSYRRRDLAGPSELAGAVQMNGSASMAPSFARSSMHSPSLGRRPGDRRPPDPREDGSGSNLAQKVAGLFPLGKRISRDPFPSVRHVCPSAGLPFTARSAACGWRRLKSPRPWCWWADAQTGVVRGQYSHSGAQCLSGNVMTRRGECAWGRRCRGRRECCAAQVRGWRAICSWWPA